MKQRSPRKRPERVLIQLRLDPEARRRLRMKTAADEENMQDALRRLVNLYTAGKIPEAEPHAHGKP